MREGSPLDRLKEGTSRHLQRVANKGGPVGPRVLQWLSNASKVSLTRLLIVFGALLLFVMFVIGLVWGGAVGSLVTVAGTLGGVTIGYWLSSRERREDERRRRRALATLLLGEIQLLYEILKDIDQAYHLKALHKVAIAPFHTAMYDQAGSDRLLFQSETVQVLAQFYSLVYTLQMELTEFRGLTPEQRTGQWDGALRVRTLYIANLIEEVMHKLSAEGGAWPLPFPSRTYTIYPEEPEAFTFPPFPKPPP